MERPHQILARIVLPDIKQSSAWGMLYGGWGDDSRKHMMSRFANRPMVSDELEKYRGAGPGLYFWRFSLSASIIFLHTFHVCYGTAAKGAKIAVLNPAFGAILPIFFGRLGAAAGAGVVDPVPDVVDPDPGVRDPVLALGREARAASKEVDFAASGRSCWNREAARDPARGSSAACRCRGIDDGRDGHGQRQDHRGAASSASPAYGIGSRPKTPGS
ncbi:hypothetical protein [Sphingomonas sp. TREG-RG-20F-R18-01]|uniref:hypothetical protein n=1 Tax=Sphingomonas sp. TREG-RG-20F-R18-01 TaxID=2914982 RepID=UPI001F5615D4|nr:hypothetical protein [Sphingomonas sp. TREG-RG-20F-R18-01]